MLFVIGIIDGASNKRLEEIRNSAISSGILDSPLYSHITFATYLGDDDTAFVASCKEMLRTIKPFQIHYEKVEMLSDCPILAAFPRKGKELASINKHIFKTWQDYLAPWTHEKIWQPHTTLLNNADMDLMAALSDMQKTFIPFDAEVVRVEFSRALENGFEIIDAVNFLEVTT